VDRRGEEEDREKDRNAMLGKIGGNRDEIR